MNNNIEKILNNSIVESSRVEFKSGFNPESIMHTICAFANDIDGLLDGYILIGINAENGILNEEIIGIDDNAIDDIQKEIVHYCKKCIFPEYIPSIEIAKYKEKNVIIINAHEGQDKPYRCLIDVYSKKSTEKAVYIRKGSITLKANENQISELIKNKEIISYDDRINYKAKLENISISLISEYLRDIGSSLINSINDYDTINIYKSIRIVDGAIENIRPKNVGLLFFNDKPSDFITNSNIVVDYIPDPTGDGMITKTFEGPIHRQIIDSLQYINNNFIEKKILKKPNQVESESIYNYPYEVLEEIIPNAVLHKDYQIPEPITIKITKEKIEVTSFPGLDSTITNDKIKHKDFASRRYKNKRIAEFLKDLHLIEAKNTGIPKAMKAMKENQSPELIFEMDEKRQYLTVIIPINNRFSALYDSISTDLKNNGNLKNKILIKLLSAPYNLTDLSLELGYKTIPNSLRSALNNLLNEGKINKNGRLYTISDKTFIEGKNNAMESLKKIIYKKLKNNEKIDFEDFGGIVMYYKLLKDLEFDGKIKLSEPINTINAPCAQYKILEVY